MSKEEWKSIKRLIKKIRKEEHKLLDDFLSKSLENKDVELLKLFIILGADTQSYYKKEIDAALKNGNIEYANVLKEAISNSNGS